MMISIKTFGRVAAVGLGMGLLLAALPSQARPPAVSGSLNPAGDFKCTVVNRADESQVGVISLIDDAGQVKKTTGFIGFAPGEVLKLTEDGANGRRYCKAEFPEFVSGELHVINDEGLLVGRSLLTVPIWK